MTGMEANKRALSATKALAIKKHWAIFPVDGKRPFRGSHGCKDATTNPAEMCWLWKDRPAANIGIATGEISNLFVLDLDEHPEKGISGSETLRDLERKLGKLPETVEAITGTGGRHLYFHYPSGSGITTGAGEQSGLGVGLDFRGDGGYVVAPGSVHPETGKLYEWECSSDPHDVEIADLPEAWITYIKSRKGTVPKSGQQKQPEGNQTFQLPDSIPEGERNGTLFRYAASMRAHNVPAKQMLDELKAANHTRCTDPLSDREIEAIYNSVLRYPEGTDEGNIKPDSQDRTRSDNAPEPLINLDECLVSLDEIEETSTEWLFYNRIPKSEITVIAGDGGSGKTSITCSIVASVSNGSKCILDAGQEYPERPKQTVLYFASEDDFSKVLKHRLSAYNANFRNIKTIEVTNPHFKDLKFNSPLLAKIIESERPALCVFDPLQSFIPPEINLGARNEMRDCINVLIGLARKYESTFIINMHTNKRESRDARSKISDSADIWDIARSVFIVGVADWDKGVRYISQEKNNYGRLSDSILFRVEDDGHAEFLETTTKRYREFSSGDSGSESPARTEARELIVKTLEAAQGHTMITADLDAALELLGVTRSTMKRAKKDLAEEGIIRSKSVGFGKTKVWWTTLQDPNEQLDFDSMIE